MNITMAHLHIKRRVMQSTRRTTPDKYLEDNCKTNLLFYDAVDPVTTQEGKFNSGLCGRFPIMSNKGNGYIHVIYVYDLKTILKTPMNNRSDKEMICDFTKLTTDLKSRGINPVFHIMDNKSYIASNNTMTTKDI